MDIRNLSLAVADEVVSEERLNLVRSDIEAQTGEAADTKDLSFDSQTLVLVGLILQICGVALQMAAILVQLRRSSLNDAVDKLLGEISNRSGDPQISQDKQMRDVAVSAVKHLPED